MIKRVMLPMVAALCALADPAAAPGQIGAAIRQLERTVAADVVKDSIGSVAVAVVANGRLVWTGAYGWADRDTRRLATPRTLYRTGSISKTITALVLLRLVDQGVVGLDDPVAGHVPELRHLANRSPGHRPITFRDLASHTAGLAREPATSHAARGPFHGWKQRLVDVIPATEVVAPPGREFRYSNIGYGILGFALERAAGRPFELLVEELVFDPLGMNDSYLVVPEDAVDRLATGYVNVSPDSVDPRVPRAEHRGRGYKVPNGGVYSTVGDLARLITAISDPSFLPDSLRRAMLTDRSRDEGAGYGLGVQLLPIGGGVLAGHSGAVAGYSAYLLLDPESASGVVLLRNYNRGETNLGAAASRLLLGLTADVSAEPGQAHIGPGAAREPKGRGHGPDPKEWLGHADARVGMVARREGRHEQRRPARDRTADRGRMCGERSSGRGVGGWRRGGTGVRAAAGCGPVRDGAPAGRPLRPGPARGVR